MADRNRETDGAPPREVHVEDAKKKNWLPWILLALGLLAALFAMSRCDNDPEAPVAVSPVEQPAADLTAMVGTTALGAYLTGTEPLPRTFTFEQVEFASGSSDLRQADASEIAAVAATLKQHPNARVQLVGYADARGDSDANARLGAARAMSVKRALVADGVAADRIDTATGGELDPADTNATSVGQSENRRTELVALQR